MQVWRIERLLKKYARCNDAAVRLMAVDMQSKFEKYWDEYSIILAMGAVLDPRYKLQMLKKAYDKIDPYTSEKKVETVKQNMVLLYQEYGKKSVDSSSPKFSNSQTPHELLTESPLEDDLNADLLELESSLKSSCQNPKSDLDVYLDDPKLDLSAFTDMEVLDYWRDNNQRYGNLALLARDVLSIPITTVASESAFSTGGRVLNPYRSRLLPKNVQALICTRNWLRGFAEFEGDIEDYFDDKDEDATKRASSSGTVDSNP